MNVVLDTSVILAAFLKPTGVASQLLTDSSLFVICTSQAILDEVKAKLVEKNVEQAITAKFLKTYLELSSLCDNSSYTREQISEDEHLVGCLERCQADLLVTLDKRKLRQLKKRKIAVTHLTQFKHYFR